ncbi:aminotransferase class I/II-fold pyridoxal phosphate-dependent enzyme [Streptococcus gallolyticus]|uniref:aminotransferase class I/II-fold pyridoxal phosphate-dependent enzyme n=1 Tax=Streptococcus hepaticus TaxID=3349163 RepID=UPI001C938C10|nr:aminotransferase class I/II-fold pyridoxal phosphate-dependent enzyme [Streptococcus gallolyticus]MBY5041877.1 aminotransferase class I/II-fold pyridoxal phosphate-dependent enzyme [Streptococcus gallolyticus]
MVQFRKDLAHLENYKIEKMAKYNLGDNENHLIDWSFLPEKLGKELDLTDIMCYGDNQYAPLLKKYAKNLGVETNQLVQGVGSDQLIHMIVTTFLNKEDTLLTVGPDFFMYQVFNELHGAQIATFPLDWTQGYPTLEALALLDYAKGVEAKVLILSNPNNPTSVAFENGQLEQVIAGFDGLVVIDEAYIDFADQPSLVNKVTDYNNLIVLRTMSKAFGLAGLRLGFAITNPILAKELDKVLPPYSMPNIVARTGELALSYGQNVAESVELNKEIRDDFIAFLLQQPAMKVLPSQTNFVTFTAPYAEKIYQAGLANDFNFKYYPQGSLANYIRMSMDAPAIMGKMKKIIEMVSADEQ